MIAAKLRVVGGTIDEQEFEISLPATIGRGRNNAITLAQPLISRQHCRISQSGDQLVVLDLGSLNGTYIGSEKIVGEAFLKPGDLLTVGTVTFRAIYGDYCPDAASEQDTEVAEGEQDQAKMSKDATYPVQEDTVCISDTNTVVDPSQPVPQPHLSKSDESDKHPNQEVG